MDIDRERQSLKELKTFLSIHLVIIIVFTIIGAISKLLTQ